MTNHSQRNETLVFLFFLQMVKRLLLKPVLCWAGRYAITLPAKRRAGFVLGIDEVKKLIGDENMTDEEAKKIRDVYHGLAELALEKFLEETQKK